MEIWDKVRLLGTWPVQVTSLNFLISHLHCSHVCAAIGAQTASRKVAHDKTQHLEVKERIDLSGTFRKNSQESTL